MSLNKYEHYDWTEIKDALQQTGYTELEIYDASVELFHIYGNGILVSVPPKEERDSEEYGCDWSEKTREIADKIEELTQPEAIIYYWW